ncbi:hypothetical protein G8V06_09310 [Clostridium botulinum D/C]|uniref:hypothetical protein n=1 Tax=Clostridium botulinum TaxID=1491 RepID=UPI001E50E72A|nr:hypothetical protein [Clostridium botulinum]MCD3234288.1 hypothetical protein [Clostridium botulinum D/C]MCD3240272.1 hypothetical protein [Clostridium botulinum D/C]MCD3267707.1 hypothetical protein [Clostridium botulinum D/C]MCD3306104.1 hypothetical protein [Clostridium botulinum D/C]MCD3314888.1 hypothetical protein [Clostridium botulinum D/C]
MNRYRVEFRVNNKNYVRQDCIEDKLEEAKKLMKANQVSEGKGKCYYRKFPLMKHEKVYF